ncbi:unnamed protein product [Adineta steineri]|uniref:DYW domain-containing protein n=1 Tax=Adineta steineri TaxID=433720 RepID=A0A813Y8R9_9BILA|nr:unnamed protein product [Adineta steineri]
MLRIFSHRNLRLLYANIQTKISLIRSYYDLISEMKKFNDKKQFQNALKLFYQCEKSNHGMISGAAVSQALKSCTNMKDFQSGLILHQRYSSLIEKNKYSLSSLIHFYMQLGDVNHAQILFDKLKNKTVGIYGAMMKGYIKNNMPQKAIDIYFQITNPDEKNISLLFNACARIATDETLNLVKKVLSNLPDRYQNDEYILTTAFDVFIKSNDLSNAERIFSKLPQNTISYGNLMSAFNKTNQPQKIFELYEQMKINQIQLNPSVCVLLINACSALGIYSISKSVSEQIPKSYLDNIFINNALIDMWGKSGCVEKAKNIFDSLIQPDTIGYTSMINSYGLNGMGSKAIELFNKMPSKLILEETYVCVLNACSHSRLVEQAQKIFSNIENKTENICTTMVDCFSRSSLFEEAENIINIYESNHSPSPAMLMSLLSGARNKNDCCLAEKTFNRIEKHFPQLTNRFISASILLANVYASTGQLDKSLNIKKNLNQLSLKKPSGFSYTEVDGQTFRARDSSHPRFKEISNEIEKISKELLSYGHKYDSSCITRSLNENETVESVLCGHSERLAIAWNFVVNPNRSHIQITKNLRVCGDCHESTKLIAMIRQCEIIVRDANRIHHFHKNGQCSCNDCF